MIKFRFENNEIVFNDKGSYDQFMSIKKSLSNTNILLVMSIEEYSKDISPKQHKLFLRLLIKGSEVSGYTFKEFEQILIDDFAPFFYEKSITGKMVKTRKTVPEMNKKEFGSFYEQCILFCSEFYNLKLE
jgi:hypothetical protein